MPARLATMSLMTMLLIAVSATLVRADDDQFSRATLKGITAVGVLVAPPDDDAKALGLTREAIQTDIELKLRLAGMRVATIGESLKGPGPFLFVSVNVSDRSALAADLKVELRQPVSVILNGEIAVVPTWYVGGVTTHPTAQGIRNTIKDRVDAFLNAWLSVNPKK